MNLPPRFILYRRAWDDAKGKWQKRPCDEHGRNINAHDLKHWKTYEDISSLAKWDETRPNAPYGVGWVLNGDGYFFIDIDDGLDPNGGWKPDVQKLYLSFTGALGEVSTSGNGLHIIGRCSPEKLTNLRNRLDGNREFYLDKRFVALSKDGLQAIGGELLDKDWTEHLLTVVPPRHTVTNPEEGRDKSYNGPEDDDKLLGLMLRSCSATGAFGDVKFSDLWQANASKLALKYPDGSRQFNHSSADAALMQHLAFWTGKNAPRMDRLYRRSALMRDKWEKRQDYRQRTIENAISRCSRVYSMSSTVTPENQTLHAEMSHDALALTIFNKRWDGEMLYVPEEDRWASWDGKRWTMATTKNDQITRLRRDLRSIPDNGDIAKRKRLGDQKTVMAVNAFMKTNEGAGRRLRDWDGDPFQLGTPTSIIDLRTGHYRPRQHSDYLLNSTAFDPAPAGALPKHWLAFLNTITAGDKDLVDFLQRVSGYAATGSTKEHRMFFAYGGGRNGKSTWLNTLAAVLSNDYARAISPKLLLDKKNEQHATDLAHIANARLARASELPVGKSWDEALIKQITGGDPITARFMRQDNFTFIPQCTLIVDANNAPSIRGVDEAISRRMCVIPFKVTIPSERIDPDLGEKLLSEGPAILSWIIDGAVRWNAHGLKIPEAVVMETNEYIEAEDTLGAFLRERLIHDPNGRISNHMLQVMFQSFLVTHGLTPWTLNTLGKEMRKRGYCAYKSGNDRGFKGLRQMMGLPTA